MISVEQDQTGAQEPPGANQPTLTATRKRQSDGGPLVLSGMENFVALARKVRRPELILTLLDRVTGTKMPPDSALGDLTQGILPVAARRALFQTVAALKQDDRQRIEHGAERVMLLDDDCGAQCVLSVLDEQVADDAAVLSQPTDRCSRALHLYMSQEFAGDCAPPGQRFDHAERRQVMNQQWKTEDYCSHYLGPKGVEPNADPKVLNTVRHRIAALFPQVTAEQFLVEQFLCSGLAGEDGLDTLHEDGTSPASVYTLVVTFNGSTARYKQLADGEIVHHEEPSVTTARFSWASKTGALGVFCDDKTVRRELAMIFRDVVLGCDGAIDAMPMREFDLSGFSVPAMLERMVSDRIDGVESMTIQQIRICRPFEQRTFDEANDRDVIQRLTSASRISRDRRDARHIYKVAYEDYHLNDLTEYVLSQVKLVVRMARQPHRRAHNVAVQITAPNGLNDNSKTRDDAKRVIEQLARIGVLAEF